jgi:hypothetical protein
MKVLSGSSSRGLTSIGPETEAITVVAPDWKVAEPSARGRSESEAVMAMVVRGCLLFGGVRCKLVVFSGCVSQGPRVF